ncbi:MAG: EamA family transporter, partial [Bacteroidales bacterium]|nr:EamA family transporter [Bacteroidales bacterium]
MNTKTKGYILGIVAAAVYGMNPLFTLPLYEAGMDADSVLFLRYLIAVPIVALMAKARGQRFKIQSNERLPMLLMGVMMAATS